MGELEQLENEIESIRLNGMQKVADLLKDYLSDTYNLKENDISVSMFGSQTIVSDFDMHVFIKDNILKNSDGTEKTKELNGIINEFINENFKTAFNDAIDEYISLKNTEELEALVSEELLEHMRKYDPKIKKGLCDFYVGSLEDLIDSGIIPVGIPDDEDDFRRGYRGRAPNVKLKFISKTHKHLSGHDVSEYMDKAAANVRVHPSEGYEKYIIETRNIAYGFLNQDGRSIAKSLIEIAHAIYIISGEGVLSEHEEKLQMGERILGIFLTSPYYSDIIHEAFSLKRGLEIDESYSPKKGGKKKFKIKKEFDWEKLQEKVTLRGKDGSETETNVPGIDCLWTMFDYLSTLFKKTVYETGYINNDKLKGDISEYITDTSSKWITSLKTLEDELKEMKERLDELKTQGNDDEITKLEKIIKGKEVDPRFLIFYLDELITAKHHLDDNSKEILKELRSSLKKEEFADIVNKARIDVYLEDYESACDLFEKLLTDEKLSEKIEKEPWAVNYSYRDVEPEVIMSKIYYEYSRALMGVRQYGLAKEKLKKAISFDPLNPDFWENLAKIENIDNNEISSNEFISIAHQLKNNEYDVFMWQNLKSQEDVKSLFKNWKSNFNKHIATQINREKKEYEAILNSILIDYNNKNGWGVSQECFARLSQLNVVSNFIEKELTPLFILNNIKKPINPFSSINHALDESYQVVEEFEGMFPLYKKAIDLFFKQKRDKEATLIELDLVISNIKKEITLKKNKSLIMETEEKDTTKNIDALLEGGFIHIPAFREVLDIFLRNKPEYKERIDERFRDVDTNLNLKLFDVRISLEEQLGKYDNLKINVKDLYNKNFETYRLVCNTCKGETPVFPLMVDCNCCGNNYGFKNIKYKKEKLSKKIDFNKESFNLTENGAIQQDMDRGYSRVYLKNIPEELKKRVDSDTVAFGLLNIDYSTNSNNNFNSIHIASDSESLFEICRAYFKKDDTGYMMYTNSKLKKFEDIIKMDVYIGDDA